MRGCPPVKKIPLSAADLLKFDTLKTDPRNISRFALRPQAHDLKTYSNFSNFLKRKGIIKKITKVETFAKP